MSAATICFFGDSFVVGHGDPTGSGWVRRVVKEAHGLGHEFTHYSLGVRGETGSQIAARIAVEAPPRFKKTGDHRLVVSFGLNDIRHGVPPAEISAAVDNCAEFGFPLLMVGPPSVLSEASNKAISALDNVLASHCAERGIPYLKTFSWTRTDSTWRSGLEAGDGLHPGRDGYRVLADVITPGFISWLAKPAS